MSEVSLQPCLLCRSVATVVIRETPDPFDSPMTESEAPHTGYVVWCTGCVVRGPWRATEAAAREVWNYHVTPAGENEE